MAALAPEIQREFLRNELENEQRVAAKAAILHNEKNARELNTIENAALIARVNKLMAGRDAWLKQMREAEIRRLARALTLAEEAALEAEVRGLLNTHPNSIANFKYESDDTPGVDPKNANKTGLEGMLSNFSSQLGLGDNPIFNFLGKLFSFIMSLIKGVQETFNPKKAPADLVDDLVKEESFDDADAELTKQENGLISKLRSVTDKDGKERAEIKAVVNAYEAKLTDLKELKITTEDHQEKNVPFAETTPDYKKNILRSRIKIFNEISSKIAPFLVAHEEVVAVDCQEKSKQQQAAQLTAGRNAANDGAHPLELRSLQARLAAVNAEMTVLAEKRRTAEGQETDFAATMRRVNGVGQIGDAFAHTGIFLHAETVRQIALDKKVKEDARKAEAAAVEATQRNHEVQMARAAAGH
ncbi:MAG TPA: hypothetical protein VNK03_04760 [Gammaproteobacteria bacterium]|nr:hypothetical protein [Gammaproteobacteria bacterium]